MTKTKTKTTKMTTQTTQTMTHDDTHEDSAWELYYSASALLTCWPFGWKPPQPP